MENQNGNEEKKNGMNVITLVGIVGVIIFLVLGFVTGGIVPVVLTMAVFFGFGRSIKKKFTMVEVEDSTGTGDSAKNVTSTDANDGSVSSFEMKDAVSIDPKSSETKPEPFVTTDVKKKPAQKGIVRISGETFENFMLRRFGLSKSGTTEEDPKVIADREARKDDLYDPDQYESVNDELSSMDPSVVTINGRKTKFKHKNNPFEM